MGQTIGSSRIVPGPDSCRKRGRGTTSGSSDREPLPRPARGSSCPRLESPGDLGRVLRDRHDAEERAIGVGLERAERRLARHRVDESHRHRLRRTVAESSELDALARSPRTGDSKNWASAGATRLARGWAAVPLALLRVGACASDAIALPPGVVATTARASADETVKCYDAKETTGGVRHGISPFVAHPVAWVSLEMSVRSMAPGWTSPVMIGMPATDPRGVGARLTVRSRETRAPTKARRWSIARVVAGATTCATDHLAAAASSVQRCLIDVGVDARAYVTPGVGRETVDCTSDTYR